MDLLQREGHYPVPLQAGKILGVEFSGTIEELGLEVKEDFKVGDEVFGLACLPIISVYILLTNKPVQMVELMRNILLFQLTC